MSNKITKDLLTDNILGYQDDIYKKQTVTENFQYVGDEYTSNEILNILNDYQTIKSSNPGRMCEVQEVKRYSFNDMTSKTLWHLRFGPDYYFGLSGYIQRDMCNPMKSDYHGELDLFITYWLYKKFNIEPCMIKRSLIINNFKIC